jgi:prolyl oligopeptidase
MTPPVVIHHDLSAPRAAMRARPRGAYASRHRAGAVNLFVIAPAERPDRPRPTILTAYGGFGVSLGPRFAPEALAWVEAGGVFAMAGVRGGGEHGAEWHRAGRGRHKGNAICDLHAAAEWLVAGGWTTPRQLGIMGASNAGLLVGAALTQRPELYAAAVCAAPLLDMVRYERSGLGPRWREEYGSARHPEELEWLLSYSPYHHVRPGTAFPATLFVVYEDDTRVDPLHARKMCAALQHATCGDAPILFHSVPGIGHGPRARSRGTSIGAEILGFLAHHTGMTGPTAALAQSRSNAA